MPKPKKATFYTFTCRDRTFADQEVRVWSGPERVIFASPLVPLAAMTLPEAQNLVNAVRKAIADAKGY